MKSNKARQARASGLVGMLSITKALVLWVMLISGIVLATRQARSTDSDVRVSVRF